MRPRHLPTPSLALAGLLLGPAALRAQDAQPGLGTVHGVVYDSLARRPLAEARVWSADGLRTATSDAQGRFRLDSVTTDGRPIGILAEHPAADSVGLSTLGTAVTLPPGGSAQVTVAVPSYATLRAAACAGIADAGDADGGILFGEVRDAATGSAIAGATAALSWIRFRGARGTGGRTPADVLTEGVDAITDRSGRYYACGLPTERTIAVRATAAIPDSVTSGELAVTIGPRRIRRRDLTVGTGALGTVVVTVSAGDGRPLAGAHVFVDDAEPVTTSEQGRATLRRVPSGTRTLGVRLIGFAPGEAVVDVAAGDTVRHELRLDAVQQLAAVRVESVRKLEEVERRRSAGIGYIVTGAQLAASPTIRTIFWTVPSMRTEGRGMLDLQLLARDRFGGWCTMRVYLDGRRSVMDELLAYRPDELLAVEVYARPGTAPAEYVSASDDVLCGVVLAWTKR